MELHLSYQLPVRSRIGCWILTFAGALVSLASAALLVYSLIDTWGYAGLIDHAIQVMLLGIALIGYGVALSAWESGVRSPKS